MDEDFKDIDVILELNKLSNENKFEEIVNLLRENLYQFNNEPNKLISLLTIRIYYNIQLKSFNDIDSDFELIESLFKDKLYYEFPYTRGAKCPFSVFLLHAYYPHLKGSSYLSLDRLYGLLSNLQEELSVEESKELQRLDIQNEDSMSKENLSNILERKIGYRELVDRVMKTVILISDVLISVLRPLEAIKLLTTINLKYNEKDISSNLLLSLIYRKLGYLEESKKRMKIFLNNEFKEGKFYKGIIKIFEKKYKEAIEYFKSVQDLKILKSTDKILKGNEAILINNLAVATLYANKSQEAKNIFFNFNINKEGFQAQRGISSNADVLKEVSIYD